MTSNVQSEVNWSFDLNYSGADQRNRRQTSKILDEQTQEKLINSKGKREAIMVLNSLNNEKALPSLTRYTYHNETQWKHT